MTEHRFGAAAAWSLGVEEELVFVDAETFAATSGYSRVVGGAGGRGAASALRPGSTGGVKPELFESLVELTTPILPDACAVLVELGRLRADVAGRAAAHGLRLHAAGSHALARGADQEVVPNARYRRLAASIGPAIRRQFVCGLHVHVSIPDPDTCLRAYEWVVAWLPVLLALSANSPFVEGEDTGRRSERAHLLLEMPTGGTPPVLATWDDWEEATRGDETRRHWDAWPRPRYGTLEVRVMDMPTEVVRSAGFAAIVQALVRAAPGAVETYDRELYARRRADAAELPPGADEIAMLAEAIRPHLDPAAQSLADAVLDGSLEAERQRDIATAHGLAAVPGDIVARTVPSVACPGETPARRTLDG